MKICVVGTGYVGLSNAMLLAQHNEVVALDIDSSKVTMLNNQQSPIIDKEIDLYLKENKLNFLVILNKKLAKKNVNFIILPTLMNNNQITNNFITSTEKVLIK